MFLYHPLYYKWILEIFLISMRFIIITSFYLTCNFHIIHTNVVSKLCFIFCSEKQKKNTSSSGKDNEINYFFVKTLRRLCLILRFKPWCKTVKVKLKKRAVMKLIIGKFICLETTMHNGWQEKIFSAKWLGAFEELRFCGKCQRSQKEIEYQSLSIYSLWMTYSKRLEVAFCKYCILFPPSLFIIRSFIKYKDLND